MKHFFISILGAFFISGEKIPDDTKASIHESKKGHHGVDKSDESDNSDEDYSDEETEKSNEIFKKFDAGDDEKILRVKRKFSKSFHPKNLEKKKKKELH